MDVLSLFNIIELQVLKQLQDNISNVTKLAIVIVDNMGNPVTKYSNFTKYCQFMRENNLCRKLCFDSDAYAGVKAARSEKPYIYRCYSGLVDVAVPIILEGQLLGSIMAGQVNVVDEDVPRHILDDEEIAKPILTNEGIKKLREKVPTMTSEELEQGVSMLNLLADYIVQVGTNKIVKIKYEKKKSLLEQNIVNIPEKDAEEINTAKFLRKSFSELIKEEDITGLIDEMARFFETTPSKYWMTHINESFLPGLFELVDEYNLENIDIESFSSTKDPDLVIKRLYILLEEIFVPIIERSKKRPGIEVELSLKYIEIKLSGDLTLTEVSEFVNMTPAYFSKLFKSKTGINFIDYLKQRRILRSKILLKYTHMTVGEVALEVGFNEANYFSRVFKEIIGISPTDFRSQNIIEIQ